MKISTDKKLNNLYRDMNFFYKWFYGLTIVSIIFGVLFNYDFYYLGIGILSLTTGRIIQLLADKLHQIRKEDGKTV